jgi:hypothetical protein
MEFKPPVTTPEVATPLTVEQRLDRLEELAIKLCHNDELHRHNAQVLLGTLRTCVADAIDDLRDRLSALEKLLALTSHHDTYS